ncbi:MAG TPA: PEP-utilizing enzyme [Conexibacter sp.]|nr:PEP-utilizing enzyme [Conexibacter sp.]
MAAGFTFGTKAETLAQLSGRLRCAEVLPLDWFTVGEWRADADAMLDRLCAHAWARGALIVRSSSLDEDTEAMSNAGHYLSRLHVTGRAQLQLAIEQVIASYHGRSDADQVLVQPELDHVIASGVASSHEPSGGGPYRVVTYSEGAHTDAVTAGRDGTRTWYCLAYEQDPPPAPPSPQLAGVLALVDELAQLIHGPFELEFGISEQCPPVLFQVRPMAMSGRGVAPALHRATIEACQSQLREHLRERPPALGPLACFGVMPDWNPAEMIGLRPRPLALSLYRCLITDRIWAESRVRYGYRDLRDVPLLIDFCGLPYIDARASFSSLVPAQLDDAPALRLVAHYVSTLRSQPQLHDKIESAIALTAYDFDTPARAADLVEQGVLSRAEASALVDALRTLTAHMMAADGPFARDLDAAARLALLRPDGAPPGSPLRRIAAQLDDCRQLGTLPFAGLARAAFVAVGLVNSLVRHGVFTDQEGAALVGGANDVTKDLRRDLSTLDRDGFLDRYGHLRPGTYDIRSARYDESFERYFDGSRRSETTSAPPRFALTQAQRAELGRLIDAHGLGCEPDALIDFIRRAVAARERSKLDFSRLVSQVLVDVRRLGEQLGFDVEDMSYVSVPTLRRLAAEPADVAAALTDAIRRGRERYRITETLCAPALLREEADLGSFVTMENEPNFVTHARVIARPADVARGDALDGRIAMIASADPGWDWIFTHDIAGLITAFGGANSHMALRALELELPAAIGVGEDRFRQWLTAPTLELDGANRLVRPMPSEAGSLAAETALRAASAGSA